LAVTHLTNAQKLKLYSALFELNRGYGFIFSALHNLRQMGVFNTLTLQELQGLSKEMQSQTNHSLLETLHDLEERDWARFGKIRNEMDKRLKGE
jgi:hypothetical protein